MIDTPTFLTWLWPGPHIDTDAVADLDIIQFSERFDWERDEWNGYKDTLQPVATTVDREAGDCEDYAFVAASWCKATDRQDVRLAVCFRPWHGIPVPRHVVCADSRRVYSSGNIHDAALASYTDWSPYRWSLTRSV